MSRLRFRILFLLLVLILLLASLIFGVLTYWLEAESPSSEPTGSERGGQGAAPVSDELEGPCGKSLPGQVDKCFPRNPFVETTEGFLVEVRE